MLNPALLGALFVALGLGLAFATWLYRYREVPVEHVGALIAARTLSVALVLLLLINPRVPGAAPSAPDDSWTLLDASLSMASDDSTAWTGARSEVGPSVVRFGQAVLPNASGDAPPDQPASRLTPALRLAAEAGAQHVRIVSDMRLDDLPGALTLLERTGLSADFEPVGGDVLNAGLSDFSVQLEEGGARATVEVFGSAGDGGPGLPDSTEVAVLQDGREVARIRVPAPAPGSVSRATAELPAPPAASWVRYTARLELDGDGFSDDNERTQHVRSDREEGGLVLLSLRPDWEPRFLLPTLADVTGYESEAFLAAGENRFTRTRLGEETTGTADSATVRRRTLGAEVVVLHGARSDDAWLRSWIGRLGRVVVLSADSGIVQDVGLEAGAVRPGEWFAEDEAPTSAAGSSLTGVDFAGFPPLEAMLALGATAGWSPVVQTRLQRNGPASPALLVGGGQRRVAVATAEGWWRWAFGGAEGRDAYRRMWSGVSAWLMEGSVPPRGEGVEPDGRSQPRGEPLAWRAPVPAGTEVMIRIEPESEGTSGSVNPALQLDTTFVVSETQRILTPALPPGPYRFVAAANGDTTTGLFDVEAYTDEMRVPVADLDVSLSRAGAGADISVSGGRRLRTSPAPYLLLIGILSAEWLLRRRRGLR